MIPGNTADPVRSPGATRPIALRRHHAITSTTVFFS